MATSRENANPTDPKVAYIISGPESSGNRLLAGILVRSGCAGEGSHNQPHQPADIPSPDKHFVLIKHTGNEIRKWSPILKDRGYKYITVIVIIREPIANVSSMVARKHCRFYTSIYKDRTQKIIDTLEAAKEVADHIEIITYEGITEQFLKQWLPMIGLPYVAGPINLPGQGIFDQITVQNYKHYQQ